MARRGLFVLVLLVVFAVAAVPVAAQTVTGTMNGTVTDRSGSRLPGVTITIRNVEIGLERIVMTNGEGFFNAPFLPVGRYTVVADLSGFAPMRRENVPINLNQTTVQDFAIDPALSETITVNAEAPRINVSDGEVKQTMQSEEIMSLPQGNQQSFLGLAQNFSGYQENMGAGQDNPTASSGSSVNFNGAGTRGTTFQINGVNNDDASENQHRQGVNLATIKSFQIVSNSFSSEFGRGYGAVVLVQTKSGTNDLAGEIYAYGQDNKYNERTFFDKEFNRARADNYWRQYGLTAGFPLMRDTLFAYVSGDVVDNQGLSNATRDILTEADLALPRLTLGNDTPENRAWQDDIIRRFPRVTPNDPRSPRAFAYQAGFDRPRDDYSARADWNMSTNNALNARYQRSHQIFDNVTVIVGEATKQDNQQSNFGSTWTNTLSSNTVQEVRLGIGLRSTNVNIKDGNDTPIVRFTGLTFGHTIGSAGNFPINRNQRDNQFVYNISSARWARHTLKLGTDIRRSHLNDISDSNTRGSWGFTNTCGGVTYPSVIHSFMAGCVSSYSVAYGPLNLKHDISEGNAYIQDDWRPWDNLVLNLGVRYEYVRAPEEMDDKIDYRFGDRTYIDPRLGFAYTPDWNRNRFLRAMTGGQGRFSVRGGFGIYHGRVFQSIFSQTGASVRFQPPHAASFGRTNPWPEQRNISDPLVPSGKFVFVPGTFPSTRVSITDIDPNLEMPTTRQWNLTLERQMFTQARMRLSYIGTIGDDLLQYRVDNKPVIPGAPGSGATWVFAQDRNCAGTTAATVSALCPVPVPIAANEVSRLFPRTNERRPNACCTNNLTVANIGEAWYHAGQLEMETGLMRGFQGRMTYTYGKALDTGSEATFVGTGDINIFPDDEDFARGFSRFDTRHRFTLSGNYLLPFFRDRNGFLGSILGGWQVVTSIKLSSGTPFTIVDSGAFDFDFDGVGNARPVCIDKNFCGGWHVNNRNTSVLVMPRTAFRRATVDDTLKDLVRRNSFRTDGSEVVDLGIYKSFRVPLTGDSIVLRLQAFNLFDHVTWSWPQNNWNLATFGQITATNYTPRTFQVGVRYIY
jgi:hypothetical protein